MFIPDKKEHIINFEKFERYLTEYLSNLRVGWEDSLYLRTK